MDVAVQEVVDRLASRLRRPAVLEDRFLRLVTYSAHDGPVDEVRESSILRRHTSADVSRWLHGVGIRRAQGPLRVPGNGELRMLPRICIPVRHRELLLGYLWFVDADESVPSADLEWCAQEVAELGTLLHRGRVSSAPSSERVTEALRALLSDSPRAAAAARNLTEEEVIGADAEIVVAVAQWAAGAASPGRAGQEALTEALIGSAYLSRRGSALHLARRDHSVLLLATPGPDARLRGQLESLHTAVTAELAASAPETVLVIGVGGCRPGLAGASESYREARMAAMVGGALPSTGPVVQWSELGVYQVAAKLVARGEVGPLLHGGLRPLLGAPEALPLLETLETYLDAAGNAQVTAEALHLHRTSLYYRLQRIEQLARTDLKDGLERLALHLTLKVARLTGHYAPRHGERPATRDTGRIAPRLRSDICTVTCGARVPRFGSE
jgi:hypothetical protein